MSFSLLPYDLLHPILSCLEGSRSHILLPCCLVDHEFYEVAVRLLYKRINIYHWHFNPKAKVGALFRTLSTCPRLASFVERLDLSGFPRVLLQDPMDVRNNVVSALQNCINLYSCRWTRDGTLTNAIIGALQRSPQNPLRELAINGRTGTLYNAEILTRFDQLTKLVLIMPNGDVARYLPRWTEVLASTLRELTILCKDGSLINDALLNKLGSNLHSLRSFSITNCANVTHTSILCLLRNAISSGGLISLSLDGISTSFDWTEFASTVEGEHLFRSLSALTLTHPVGRGWALVDIVQLISLAPLRELNINNVGLHQAQDRKQILIQPTDLVRAVIKAHGANLETLGLLRMSIADEALAEICCGLPRLRKFFFTRDGSSAMDIRSLPLPRLRHLEYFHISFMSEDNLPFPGVPSEADIVTLVEQCSSELHQCGFDTRVWKVNREFTKQLGGEWIRKVTLGPYDKNEIPEAFLVVRT